MLTWRVARIFSLLPDVPILTEKLEDGMCNGSNGKVEGLVSRQEKLQSSTKSVTPASHVPELRRVITIFQLYHLVDATVMVNGL